MSNEVRFMLKALVVGVVLVLAVVYLTPSAVYAPLVWLFSPLKAAADPIYHNIQSHPDGWFRWTVIVLLVLILRRIGQLVHHGDQRALRDRFQNYMSDGSTYGSAKIARQWQNHDQWRLQSIRSGFISLDDATPEERAKLSEFEISRLSVPNQMNAKRSNRTGYHHTD